MDIMSAGLEPNTKVGIELDKFKRRLIRAVARLLLVEKKSEEEVWDTLRKETGSDCRVLWIRMRALTLKKLHRLFAANDCVFDIPRVARMSFTDWLLFDLVLVHQKVDVIGQDNPAQNPKRDPKPLVALFELVKQFRIEGRRSESLAGAWSALTLKYNSQGHQCSPMLLQLRWYQLKEATRDKFYNFWFAYRGTAKRLSLAEPHTPTCLQAAIAKEYKDIVTKPFLEWEEMIKNRLVTLPEEFEKKMRSTSTQRVIEPNPSDDVPDLVVIEPQIETIDLRVESDTENETKEPAEKTLSPPELPVKIKEEPLDMEMDIEETRVEEPKKSMYEVVLESTALEQEKIDNIDDAVTEPQITDDEHGLEENVIKIEDSLKTPESVLPLITSVFGNVSDTSVLTDNTLNKVVDTPVLANVNDALVLDNINETPVPANDNDNMDKNFGLVKVSNTTVLESIYNTSVVDEEENIKIGDTDIHEANLTLSRTNALSPQGIEISDSDQDIENDQNNFDRFTKPDSPIDTIEKTHELRNEDTSRSVDQNTQGEAIDVDIKPDINDCTIKEPFKLSNVNEDALVAEDTVDSNLNNDFKQDISSFSYGELSNDINFVDDGIELVDDGVVYEDEDENDEINEAAIPKIDPKLLMCPIIYTTKLDDMGLFHTTPFAHIEGKQLLDAVMLKSKPIKIVAKEDLSETDDSSDDEVTDNQRVKLSSYMLQKPRSRSYNPIQLCKNPDFNTRLKRLTVGFFSYPRNRGLIKSCKPLTIDVSKVFETKLISGTLYLKPSDQDVKPEIVDDTETRQSVTVVPSAMPAQSLIDNSKIGDILPIILSSEVSSKPPDESSSTCERNKVINLPDISEIRRINQRLLTAEVTPIQVQNSRPLVPVSIVTSTQTDTTPSVGVAQIDARGPPNIVDVTTDSPANKNTESNTFTDNSLHTFETHKSARRHPQDNSLYSGNSRGRRKIGPAVSWKPRPMRPEIPWYSKNPDLPPFPSKVEETLLTLDTLNKMLYLLSNDTEQPKSKQKKTKGPQQQPPKKQTAQPKSPPIVVQSVTETPDNQTEIPKKIVKPKINIKSAVCYRQKKQKQTGLKTFAPEALEYLSESDTDQDQHSDDKKKEINYCCWARQRMLQMLFSRKRIPSHPCPYPLCSCCCRTLLEQYIVNDHKIRKAQMQDGSATPNDELCENVATNSETVIVEHTEVLENTPVEVPQERLLQIEESKDPAAPAQEPVSDVEALEDTLITTVTQNKSIDTEALELQDDVPSLGGEVCVSTTSVVLPETNTLQPCRSPAIPIDTSINITGPRSTTLGPRKRRVHISQPVAPSQVLATSTPSLRKVLAVKKRAAANTLAMPMPPLHKLKPFTPPKNFKEKMIFLNSKQISENPAENPIFLGKNKILLTTTKFPSNLRKFEEAKQALKSSLKIPNGVQLICLPNGSITYTIDQNIEVNATDLASMPAIIAQVQAEINKLNPIVNLIDDDDDDKPKDNEIKNVESSSEAAVPTIELDGTEDTINLPHDSSHVETEKNNQNSKNENMTDNTNTNIEETNEIIHSNQNAVPVQQDVQLLNQTEIPSTSAEHKQPTTTSTEVSQESTTEPSTINKSKNILSDLMEMSGIFEEDVTPTPEETLPAGATEQQVATANISKTVEAQPVVAHAIDTTKPTQPIKQMHVMPKVSYENNTLPIVRSPLGELSPITSLYELKYACLNNGIFFKLDFETGYLVPINVCMKQQPRPAHTPKPIDPKSVIDLTEDENEEPTPTFSLSNKESGPTFSLSNKEPAPTSSSSNKEPAPTSSSSNKEPAPTSSSSNKEPAPPTSSSSNKEPAPTFSLSNKESSPTFSVSNKGPAPTFSVSNKGPAPTFPVSNKSDKRSLLIINNPSNKNLSKVIPAVTSTSSSPVKPVKLFRAVKPPILQRRISQTTPTILDKASNNDTAKNKNAEHKLKRKQFIRTVDLTNKDEETAIDKPSVSKENYRKKRKIDDVTTKDEDSAKKAETTSPELPKKQMQSNSESDDSSDEEPLSNLAKRKRENEIQLDTQNEAHPEKQNDDQPDNQNVVESSDKQNEVQPESEDVYMSDNEPAESETQYELILEKTMADEAEEEDQCILGV